MDGSGRATLQSIAARAGVHVSTVSRVLRSTGTSTEKAIQIRRIAEELGYVPDPNAASLRTRRSSTIGVLVPRLTDIVLAAVYDAVELAANSLGFDTFVANTHDDPAEQLRRIELLLSRRVDGLILGDAHLDGANLDVLNRRGVPFVLVNRRSGEALSVSGDDLLGGRLVGEYLCALGHERIGIVSGPVFASTAVDRARGCRDAAAEAGVRIQDRDIVRYGFDVVSGREGALRLLARKRPPTAIFAADDFMALGVLSALREKGLKAGRDIAVVGYNDVPIAAELAVPLTTVHNPLAEMGSTAVTLLQALLRGQNSTSQILAPRLVVRQTTASPTTFVPGRDDVEQDGSEDDVRVGRQWVPLLQ